MLPERIYLKQLYRILFITTLASTICICNSSWFHDYCVLINAVRGLKKWAKNYHIPTPLKEHAKWNRRLIRSRCFPTWCWMLVWRPLKLWVRITSHCARKVKLADISILHYFILVNFKFWEQRNFINNFYIISNYANKVRLYQYFIPYYFKFAHFKSCT